MLNFIGEDCPVCGKEFSEGEDIVVCPICGTPHHRECYKIENKCANESYHKDKKVWEPTKNQGVVNNIENTMCPKCKAINPKGTEKCMSCGFDLKSQNANVSATNVNINTGNFIDDIKINGLSLQNFHIYLRVNQKYFLSKFKQHENDKFFLSFNWSAFIFSFIYYFYRKMYKTGIAVLLLILLSLAPVFSLSLKVMPQIMEYMNEIIINRHILSTIAIDFTGHERLLSIANFCARLPFVISMVGAIIANYLYRNKTIKDINNIISKKMPVKETNLKLYLKGGVSFGNAISIILFVLAAYFVFVNVVSMNLM